MSGRAGEQGHGGRRGGGQGGQGGGRGVCGFVKKNQQKKRAYTSTTQAIKHDIFDCSKPEHAGLFDKSIKAIINHHMMSGDNKSNTVAHVMENMQLTAIPRPPDEVFSCVYRALPSFT